MQIDLRTQKIVCQTVFLKPVQILLTLSTLVIISIISASLLIKVCQAELVSVPVTLHCKRWNVWLTRPLIRELLTCQQPASITEVKSSLIY